MITINQSKDINSIYQRYVNGEISKHKFKSLKGQIIKTRTNG